MMISGQGFFELEACSSTTEAVRKRMAVTAAFAFDHPGPDVDPTYNDRQYYKIEIMWTINQGINRLNGQQLSTDDISMDDIDGEHPVWYPEAMTKLFQILEDRFRLLFAEGEALKPSRHYSPIPGLTGQTVVRPFSGWNSRPFPARHPTLCFAFHNTFSITSSSAKLLN
ncbi:hypothetical protein NCU08781 [Neurospora crassa OR74A]|uniref:Uncharacterized protein n=1 Tax=Neurospora crassa (strain ATCC 24698 / 74-OR23-1A / CBS 708.71 / DSM 1257 / FGSC 987) TaxID=367110 RepID=Q7RWY2_NEUCR|nr:hypothetical protein NCU08781 [Neurospora crassa OR74A]EAA26988.1 hypothetical protein NCU08781 [Neurospora crassa OR74A]|eukprot:XP_956224.1 hypothetical protein NCU08781 [Neurospora crassa OR74A]